MTAPAAPPPTAAATGVAGLDDILSGGLTRDRLYLVEGTPGAGKTTLSLQFLLAGAAAGEAGLYITLSETRDELAAVAAAHGWSLGGITVLELVADEGELQPDNQYTMFAPSELELNETTRRIIDEVERLKPRRVVVDSLSEVRLLAQNSLRYRRQVLALKQFFTGRGCTVILLDDKTAEAHDLQLQSIAHGVISLEQLAPEYGAERRRLRVVKYRGVKYRGGFHDFVIGTGGLEVFPRLVAAEHGRATRADAGLLRSGVGTLDVLLGGGIERGTSVLILGPAGCGKSSLAAQYALSAVAAGGHAALFIFEESAETLAARVAGLGMDVEGALASGRLTVQQVDPAELSPGEFAHAARRAAEPDDGSVGARVVVIDSLNGYLNAMPDERHLLVQLREMLTYLGQKGVVTLLVVGQHGMTGDQTSYLADAVILFRYFEADGEVRVALSVVKKRRGWHERTIREFKMDGGGLRVGEALREFHGVLSGTPRYKGTMSPLMGGPGHREGGAG